MATSNRTSMTVRGLGSWRGGPLELDNVSRLIADAATCHAVERRDTKIDPVPPGMPTTTSQSVGPGGA